MRPVLIVRPAVLNCSANNTSALGTKFAVQLVKWQAQVQHKAHLLTAGASPSKVVISPYQERGKDGEKYACRYMHRCQGLSTDTVLLLGNMMLDAWQVARILQLRLSHTESNDYCVAHSLVQGWLAAEEVNCPGKSQ